MFFFFFGNKKNILVRERLDVSVVSLPTGKLVLVKGPFKHFVSIMVARTQVICTFPFVYEKDILYLQRNWYKLQAGAVNRTLFFGTI